jgi:hypothetical protein
MTPEQIDMSRMSDSPSRRRFLGSGIGLAALSTTGDAICTLPASGDGPDPGSRGLISGIERQVIFNGRQGGTSWFHPRASAIPEVDSPLVLMTLQSISGSDVFGPVHWTTSNDLGRTWKRPEPIPGLGRRALDGGWEVGTCDVVPEYHPPTNTVLAVGHNVYYRNGVLANPQRSRWPVSIVWSPAKGWSKPRPVRWDDSRGTAIYTCGCSQRVVLPGGDVLVPLSFGPEGRQHRSVTTVRCSFDGRELHIRKVGTELIKAVKRGLLEPSLTRLDGRFYLTIRAEDERGYVSASDDGLAWGPARPWCWDDGEPLAMSSTQQHWLTHREGLFLVYTRKSESNARVLRWRSPLYVSQVDRKSLRLIRSTERVVLPLVGDGLNAPKHVALMGNFHPVNVSPNESWVTVGEGRSNDGWHGDTLLARIGWSRPSRPV